MIGIELAPMGAQRIATHDEVRLLSWSDALSGRKGLLVRLLVRMFVG